MAFAGVLLLLAGCSDSGMDVSRAVLYDSVQDLSTDTAAVVIGTVVDQAVEAGSPIPTTVSTVEVQESFRPTGLGTRLSVAAGVPPVGATVRVRQSGTTKTRSVPAPMLERGGRYLLFLTPSMLAGPAAADYFITGGQPGGFMIEGDNYLRVVKDSGDRLPVTITRRDLT